MSLLIALLLALFLLHSPWNVAVVVGACFLELGELWWGLKLARRRSNVGDATIIGRTARVVRALDPVGQVAIEAEIWTARAAVSVPVGATVVVRARDGLELRVDPRERVDPG